MSTVLRSGNRAKERLPWSQDRERQDGEKEISRQKDRTEMRERQYQNQGRIGQQDWGQERATGPTARERGRETARNIVLHCVLQLKREIRQANTEECSRESGCFIARYWVMPLYTCGSVFVRDRHICVSAPAVPVSPSAVGSDSRLLWISGTVLVGLLNDKRTWERTLYPRSAKRRRRYNTEQVPSRVTKRQHAAINYWRQILQPVFAETCKIKALESAPQAEPNKTNTTN